MNFEIGKTYMLDCYFSETALSVFDEDEWVTISGKGGVYVTPLTDEGVLLLELYEFDDQEIDLKTSDFDCGAVEYSGAEIDDEPDYLEDVLIVQKRRDTESF